MGDVNCNEYILLKCETFPRINHLKALFLIAASISGSDYQAQKGC